MGTFIQIGGTIVTKYAFLILFPEHAGMCRRDFLRQLSTGFKDENGKQAVGGQASLLQYLPSSPFPLSLFPLSTHLPFLMLLLLPAGGACGHVQLPRAPYQPRSPGICGVSDMIV